MRFVSFTPCLRCVLVILDLWAKRKRKTDCREDAHCLCAVTFLHNSACTPTRVACTWPCLWAAARHVLCLSSKLLRLPCPLWWLWVLSCQALFPHWCFWMVSSVTAHNEGWILWLPTPTWHIHKSLTVTSDNKGIGNQLQRSGWCVYVCFVSGSLLDLPKANLFVAVFDVCDGVPCVCQVLVTVHVLTAS